MRAQRWVERTPPGFVFNIKTYRLFTRHQTPVISMAKELREAVGPVEKRNVYDKDLPDEVKMELWRQFRAGDGGAAQLRHDLSRRKNR